MPTYIAEHIPAHLFDKSLPRPRTDEDAQMSAPVTVTRTTNRGEAYRALGDRLRMIANFRHVQLNGESDMFRAAGDMFTSAARTRYDNHMTLQIHGRVYRVREEG